jgi:hypothetical protein
MHHVCLENDLKREQDLQVAVSEDLFRMVVSSSRLITWWTRLWSQRPKNFFVSPGATKRMLRVTSLSVSHCHNEWTLQLELWHHKIGGRGPARPAPFNLTVKELSDITRGQKLS